MSKKRRVKSSTNLSICLYQFSFKEYNKEKQLQNRSWDHFGIDKHHKWIVGIWNKLSVKTIYQTSNIILENVVYLLILINQSLNISYTRINSLSISNTSLLFRTIKASKACQHLCQLPLYIFSILPFCKKMCKDGMVCNPQIFRNGFENFEIQRENNRRYRI